MNPFVIQHLPVRAPSARVTTASASALDVIFSARDWPSASITLQNKQVNNNEYVMLCHLTFETIWPTLLTLLVRWQLLRFESLLLFLWLQFPKFSEGHITIILLEYS